MAPRATTTANASQIKPAALRNFHARLAAWYRTHGRHDLPWRQTDDPYHIWLSEVMLQQTQVSTVLARFYHPFLATFPTIETLAKAPREAVLKAWEGLGYYRRAGFLHEAAKKMMHEGGLPPFASLTPPLCGSPSATQGLFDRLLSFPGIGKNTAHAILAFAYHQPVAILEANVKRVVARIFALKTPSDTELWAGAEALLNRTAPFDYNQAMMDLGSLICTPKTPNCSTCPARTICAGKESPEHYPTPKIKKKTPTRTVMILIREDAAKRLFLEARDAALLGGLYGFAQLPADTAIRHDWQFLGNVTHIYSHFRLEAKVYRAHTRGEPNSADWHTRAALAALPLSTLDHKVLALLNAAANVPS